MLFKINVLSIASVGMFSKPSVLTLIIYISFNFMQVNLIIFCTPGLSLKKSEFLIDYLICWLLYWIQFSNTIKYASKTIQKTEMKFYAFYSKRCQGFFVNTIYMFWLYLKFNECFELLSNGYFLYCIWNQ